MTAKTLNERAMEVLCDYYAPRAKWLQLNCNWSVMEYRGPEADSAVNDPLMQRIEIYDCFTRNAAGFSNTPQDLWMGTRNPKRQHQDADRWRINAINDKIKWGIEDWLYAFMCHRITGSGTSFTRDHGYHNSLVSLWGRFGDFGHMVEDLEFAQSQKKVIFTSIGNQPPAPKKGVSNIDFMIHELPGLILDFCDWFTKGGHGHHDVVNYLNAYNLRSGHRRFSFQYTAFAMDCSDYFPQYCDPHSHLPLGNNALRCMKRVSTGYKPDEFMDVLQRRLDNGTCHKDAEDLLCDFVRFGQNYIPRTDSTYDHVPSHVSNNSGWESGWENRQGKPHTWKK